MNKTNIQKSSFGSLNFLTTFFTRLILEEKFRFTNKIVCFSKSNGKVSFLLANCAFFKKNCLTKNQSIDNQLNLSRGGWTIDRNQYSWNNLRSLTENDNKNREHEEIILRTWGSITTRKSFELYRGKYHKSNFNCTLPETRRFSNH